MQVGSTTMSSNEALKANLRGKALRITHYYRDLLWQVSAGNQERSKLMSSLIITYLFDLCRESVEGHYVPNAGFFEDIVFEDPALSSSCQASCSCEGSTDDPDNQQNTIDNKNIGESDETSDVISETNAASSMQNNPQNAAEEITENVGDLKLVDSVEAAPPNVEEQLSLSTEDVDSHLDKCLLQALHTTVKDKDLPMPGSTLW